MLRCNVEQYGMLAGLASVIFKRTVRSVAAMERSCTSFATMLTVGATAIGPVTVGLLLGRGFLGRLYFQPFPRFGGSGGCARLIERPLR